MSRSEMGGTYGYPHGQTQGVLAMGDNGSFFDRLDEDQPERRLRDHDEIGVGNDQRQLGDLREF